MVTKKQKNGRLAQVCAVNLINVTRLFSGEVEYLWNNFNQPQTPKSCYNPHIRKTLTNNTNNLHWQDVVRYQTLSMDLLHSRDFDCHNTGGLVNSNNCSVPLTSKSTIAGTLLSGMQQPFIHVWLFCYDMLKCLLCNHSVIKVSQRPHPRRMWVANSLPFLLSPQ